MAEFGDIEPDDVWDNETTIAPEQVAQRLHRLRRYLETLAGHDPGPWHELDRRSRDEALELGDEFVGLLADEPEAGADEIAEDLHSLRRRRAGDDLPPWHELGADEQDLAIAIVDAIIAWLQREGPRP